MEDEPMEEIMGDGELPADDLCRHINESLSLEDFPSANTSLVVSKAPRNTPRVDDAPPRRVLAYEPARPYEPEQLAAGFGRSPEELRVRSANSVEDRLVYEEEDRVSNITRRQVYSRLYKPETFWDKHNHFRQWVHAVFISICLVGVLVIILRSLNLLREGSAYMTEEEADHVYHRSAYAQKMFEKNLCDIGPPVELLERCSELDRLRRLNHDDVPQVFGFLKMVKRAAQILVGDMTLKIWLSLLLPLTLSIYLLRSAR